jgi:hypothetical protein
VTVSTWFAATGSARLNPGQTVKLTGVETLCGAAAAPGMAEMPRLSATAAGSERRYIAGAADLRAYSAATPSARWTSS